jgi:Outer membrane protein beta-barrel domain
MLRSFLVLLLLSCSAIASAEDFSYNYLYLGYGTIDVSDANVDGSGIGIGGSFAVNDQFHVFAGYQMASMNFNIDATMWNAGLGYHMGLNEKVDLVGTLSYNYVKLDAGGGASADDNGLGLGVGLRFAAGNDMELDAGIDYVDYSDSGSDTAFSAAFLYNFNKQFTVGLHGSWGNDFSSYMFSGRYYFGN